MRFQSPKVAKIFINADDFAQSEAVDQAIIHLAKQNIIHGTSALVLSPRWKQSAKSLAEVDIQAGLHLDLTSAFTHTLGYNYSLNALIMNAYLRQLDVRNLSDFIALQYDAFVAGYGQAPDFIDGHQHVHQLPMVRKALFEVLSKKGWGQQPQQWLRICSSNRWRGLKALIIQKLGAEKTRKMAENSGIKTNTDFTGVYDFDPKTRLKPLWQNWLRPAKSRQENPAQDTFSVTMCHVATPNMADDPSDPIYHARVNEYQWLISEQFKNLAKIEFATDVNNSD